MPVKKDPSGRRSVEASAEVPGTPEAVWEAIATGPGISSWFVPSTVEPRVGGKATANFGPGMDSRATVTAWEPPRRFAMESQDEMGPGGPFVASEWTVEARSGGICLVRVVHTWTTDDDRWDKEFEGMEQGWPAFFRILRIYLTHFRKQPSAAFQMLAMTSGSQSDAWSKLMSSLSLNGPVHQGDEIRAKGASPVVGVVESVGPPDHPELLVRLHEPAPGVGHFFALPMGGSICVPVRFYFYGKDAESTAAVQEPRWSEWVNSVFPAGSPGV